MRRTILDIYVTYEGDTRRHVTLADFAKRGAGIYSDRESLLDAAKKEVDYLLCTKGTLVRVYDTFTMQYTEFQS